MDEFYGRTTSTLPIFRSEAQFRLLGELYTRPAAEATIGDLAERIDVPHPTVSREVKRLVEAGLLHIRAQGRQTLVSADTGSPIFEDLRSLLTKLYGVLPVLREEFAGNADQVVVFGSWAARWLGEPGPQPRDIDVLVVTDDPADLVWDAAARASRRLGMDVNVVVRTGEAWAGDDSGFAQELRQRPSVVVDSRAAVAPRRARRAAPTPPGERRWG